MKYLTSVKPIIRKLFSRFKRKKEYPVEYQISIDGCVITFKDVDAKRYKHIELCLTGLAKLLNLVRDNNDWEMFTGLMQAVVEELGAKGINIADRSKPAYVI